YVRSAAQETGVILPDHDRLTFQAGREPRGDLEGGFAVGQIVEPVIEAGQVGRPPEEIVVKDGEPDTGIIAVVQDILRRGYEGGFDRLGREPLFHPSDEEIEPGHIGGAPEKTYVFTRDKVGEV